MRTVGTVGAEWWRPVAARVSVLPEAPPDRSLPFGALLVFTFIMLLSPQTYIPGLARLRIALLTGAFAVAAHCWTRFAARRPLVRFTRETWLAAGLFGWAVATLPLSMWPGGSLQILLDLYIKALIVFCLLSNTVTTVARLRTVAWGLSLMAMLLAVTAVRHFSAHPAGSRIIGYESALAMNPNDLALMLNLILPLTVALFLLSRRPMLRGLLAGLIALDAGAVVTTFSRGGFLTLATILVLYLRTLQRRRQWKWAVAALVLAVAAVPLLPSGYVERLGTITDIRADQTGSAQARWGDTQAALAFVLSHPLAGAGLGMNILALNDLRGAHWLQVHNAYLEYAMDLGWIGLGLFLLLLIGCIRTAARLRDRCADLPALRDLSVLADAIRIALVGFGVAALFHPVAYSFYFYYVAGLAVALSSVYATETRRLSHAVAPARMGDDGQWAPHDATQPSNARGSGS